MAAQPEASHAPVMDLGWSARLYPAVPPAQLPRAVWVISAAPQQDGDSGVSASSAQEQHSGGLPSSKHLAFNMGDWQIQRAQDRKRKSPLNTVTDCMIS